MNTIIVPCLFDNFSYIVRDEQSQTAVVVDPSEGWPVMKVLEEHRLTLAAVLCTHHHADHLGGLDDLRDEYQGVAVYGSDQEQRISSLTHRFSPGETLAINNIRVRTTSTPGHTLTSVVYQIDDMMFTGDTLFGAGCGRLFEGSAAQMFDSLKTINREDSQTKVYTGHEYTLTNLRFAAEIEPDNQEIRMRQEQVQQKIDQGDTSMPSSLENERRTNPFLRCHEPGVIHRLKAEHGLTDQSEIAVFSLLRALRNDFS